MPSLDASASPADLLVLLVLAHFLCDFSLQSDRMAREKLPGSDHTLNWRWWLLGHSASHGLAVALISGLPLLGVAETALHGLIDWCKGRYRLSMAIDQSLHLLCKLAWVGWMVCS